MTSSGRWRCWLRLITVVLLAISFVSVRDFASAQEATPTVAPMAPDGEGPREDKEPASPETDLSGAAKAWLVGGLLLLAVVTVAMHYYFLNQSRREYFRAASLLFRKGVYPQPVPILAQGDATGGTIAPLEVIGSMALQRGQPGVFVALHNGVRDEQVVWTVEPADAATAMPEMGAVTSVTATREGSFSLSAAIDQGPAAPPQTITVLPDATSASASSPGLPFIGQGFASLVGAVVLIAAVVVLAAIRVDSWEVIGTIFGALAGYLFGTATNNRE